VLRLPLLGDGFAVRAADVDAKTASGDVKAGGEDQDVELRAQR
jgi:hypothetical protein